MGNIVSNPSAAQTITGYPLTIDNPGTFSDTQINTNLVSSVNSGVPISVGSGNQTDAFTSAIIAPSSGSSVQNINAVGAYVTTGLDSRVGGNDRETGNGVAIFSQSIATGSHAAVWGFNPIVTDDGTDDTNLTGIEVDIGSDASPFVVQGIVVEMGGSGTAPDGTMYFLAHFYGSTFKGTWGFVCDTAATSSGIAFLANPAGFGNNQNSQSISFVGTDSIGTSHSAYIYGDPDGDLVLQPEPSTGNLHFYCNALTMNDHQGATAGPYSAITSIQCLNGIITSLADTSDERLKTNIKPFTKGLGAITALSPKTYTWNEAGQKLTGFRADREFSGLTAQDLQKAIPEAVSSEGEYLAVSDRPVIAALINAVKELSSKCDSLCAQLRELKEREPSSAGMPTKKYGAALT
jgi:hypothetical protein